MNFKRLKLLTIILLLGIFAQSCNKEEDSVTQTQNHLKTNNVKHIKVEELFRNDKFKQSIEKIPAKTKNYTLRDGETVMEHDYGFTIERFKPANVFENDSIISYTLLITRPNQTDHSVENLVINTNKLTGNISALIIKYVSDSQITNFSNFNGERTITPIVYNPNQYQNSTTGRVYYDCITVTYFICTNPNATHLPGGPGCEALPNTTTTCGWFDTGSGGAGGSSTGGNTSGTSTGGGGGTVTSPVYQMSALESAQKEFTMGLSDVQKDWLRDNPESATDIFAYLAYSDANTDELPYSFSKKQNVKNLISFSILNNSTFKINRNLNSTNSLNFSNIDEFQNFINNFSNVVTNEMSTVSQQDRKVAKITQRVNGITDFNVEVNQTMLPYKINSVSSSMSGYTICFGFNQTTPADAADISTNGNVVTVTFSANLDFNLFLEGIGTLHTFHLTFVVKIDKNTGSPISINIIGLP